MRRTFAAAIGAVSVAAVLSGAGLAAASASPTRSAGPKIEHFRGMTTSIPGSRPISMIATGVFTAGGVDIITSATADIFRFPGGTIKVRHHAVRSTPTVNSRTCLFTVSESGTYKLTGGTGKYAGISGSGTYTLSILAVLARDSKSKCSMALTPAATQLILNLHGPVKL
jgi:hypothetical protein